MKQTAVEWLMEQISYDNGFGQRRNSFSEDFDLSVYFEQAKEMEKKQIVKFSKVVLKEYKWIRPEELSTIKRLYNETFKTNKK